MGITVDTDDMAHRAARIAAAAAEARALTEHSRQMVGTAGGLAEGATSAAMIGFVAALSRSLDGDTRGLERLGEALRTYAAFCSDVERSVGALAVGLQAPR